MPDSVTVALKIDELMELIRYHREMYEGIPKELYDRMTMAGHTLAVTAQKQKDRMWELDDLLQATWPK